MEEARAGHVLIERKVAQAEAALAAAQGRRERRQAESELESARSMLEASAAALEGLAKRLGEPVHLPEVRTAPAVTTRTQPAGRELAMQNYARFADKMTLADALQTVRTFGERRRLQGDGFLESQYLEGAFFYETGDARTGVRVWGGQDDWAISVFAAARVGMRPTFELYRYISRWRTTSGSGAPYVVEDGERAAVMCERSFQSSQLASDTSAWRLISSTIDLIGESALKIARALHNADGVAFTAKDEVGLGLLLSWWEIDDEHVTRALRND